MGVGSNKFKQTLVKGLSLKNKLLRYVNNYFLSHIIDTPTIPNLDTYIKAFFLNYSNYDNNIDIFSQMLDISNDYVSKIIIISHRSRSK